MKEELPYATNYHQLMAYKLAVELAHRIFYISKSFPKMEDYSLTNQIRRSSRSVGAQIAEAWGKRSYIKHFKSKLTDAIAELNETEHWIEMSLNSEYITRSVSNYLQRICTRIKKLLFGMIRKADRFCKPD